MSSENIHLLGKEIHSTFDPSVLSGGLFESKLVEIAAYYPYQDSQNYHMFVHAIQELNRKYDKFGLADRIILPIDAGFRPLNLDDFFGDLPTPGVPDYLELEDGFNIVLEDGSRITLEQDEAYIDLEDGFELLQENGFKILLRGDGNKEYVDLENGFELLQENRSKILLEQYI